MANLSNINNKFLVTTGGNVLIGKTAANNATVGTQIMSTGDINPTVSGDTVARFNRLGTDGEIIRFQHDTLTDGAINSLSGRIAIGSGTTGVFFDSIRDVLTPHNMTTNAYSSNISLGRDLIRFKDIYLSGKVVAGTGSTAAATINAYSTTVSAGLHSALRIIENTGASSYWDIGATNGASTILNFYHNAATTPKITFTHTGGATFAGNVTATGRLTVNTGGGIAAYFNGNGSNYTQGAITLQSSNESTPEVRGQGVFMYNQGTDTTWYTGTTYNNADRFIIGRATNASLNTEAARADNAFVTVLNSGNVGIGTTSPNSKLTVSGPATPDLGNGENSIRIECHTSSAASPGELGNGINFAQKWWSGSAGLQVTGGIYGIKNAGNGTYGGGLAFYTQPSSAADMAQRMIIDTSGNVGIGLTNPSWQLEVQDTGTVRHAISSTSNGTAGVFFRVFNSGTQVGNGTVRTDNSGNMSFFTGTSGEAERMRITSGGDVLMGEFAANGSIDPAQSGFGFQGNGLGTASCNFSNTNEMFVFNQRDGQGTTQIDFRNGNVERGKIQWTTSGTTYNTTSDYRVKENLKDFNGLDKVSKIKVYDFDWIESKKQDYGVIAHELQEILPLAVTGEKDAEKMQGVDYSKIVPLLVKSIQELKVEIELLKSK